MYVCLYVCMYVCIFIYMRERERELDNRRKDKERKTGKMALTGFNRSDSWDFGMPCSHLKQKIEWDNHSMF